MGKTCLASHVHQSGCSNDEAPAYLIACVVGALSPSLPFPCSLAPLRGSVLLAVNQSFVASQQQLQLGTGDEVAVIPPISGG